MVHMMTSLVHSGIQVVFFYKKFKTDSGIASKTSAYKVIFDEPVAIDAIKLYRRAPCGASQCERRYLNVTFTVSVSTLLVSVPAENPVT